MLQKFAISCVITIQRIVCVVMLMCKYSCRFFKILFYIYFLTNSENLMKRCQYMYNYLHKKTLLDIFVEMYTAKDIYYVYCRRYLLCTLQKITIMYTAEDIYYVMYMYVFCRR